MSASPDPFAAPVAAETAAHNDAVRAALRRRTWPPKDAPAYRADVAERIGPLHRSPSAIELAVTDDGGPPVGLRVFHRPACRGVYLYLHGGGWCVGGADQQDRALEELAATTDLSVVSVDYRLAPEHPFPAGLDDVERAARWLIRHSRAEFGTERLLLGGDSAGANLGLAALQRLRETGDQDRFAVAAFTYGWFDATLTPSAAERGTERVLTAEMLAWYLEQYLPAGVDPADPFVSPLRGELAGLPPTLLTVGTLDALLDDSLFLHARLRAAGVPAEIHLVPGGDHAFDQAPIAIARAARDGLYDFLVRS